MMKLMKWIKERRENYDILRREVEIEGKRYEKMSYEELQKPPEELSCSRVVNGVELFFSAESYNTKPNGDLCFCVDVDGLPCLFVKPSYQFYKRKDGSVYY